MHIKNKPVYTPLLPHKTSFQTFKGVNLKKLETDTFTKVSSKFAFTGSEPEKSKLTTSMAYLWAKKVNFSSPSSYKIGGHTKELKRLLDEGVTVILAPKHYDAHDIPSLINLMYQVSDNYSDFHNNYPHLLRGKNARKASSLRSKLLNKADEGLGVVLVDVSGNGKGKEALIKSLNLISQGKNFMIFPEGGAGLKYKGQPISKEKQTFQPIKNGLSHIIVRLLDKLQNGKVPKERKVVVIPIGISGENATKEAPTTLYVEKPIDINSEIPAIIEDQPEYYDKISKLNEYLQNKLQQAQHNAYKLFNKKV